MGNAFTRFRLSKQQRQAESAAKLALPTLEEEASEPNVVNTGETASAIESAHNTPTDEAKPRGELIQTAKVWSDPNTVLGFVDQFYASVLEAAIASALERETIRSDDADSPLEAQASHLFVRTFSTDLLADTIQRAAQHHSSALEHTSSDHDEADESEGDEREVVAIDVANGQAVSQNDEAASDVGAVEPGEAEATSVACVAQELAKSLSAELLTSSLHAAIAAPCGCAAGNDSDTSSDSECGELTAANIEISHFARTFSDHLLASSLDRVCAVKTSKADSLGSDDTPLYEPCKSSVIIPEIAAMLALQLSEDAIMQAMHHALRRDALDTADAVDHFVESFWQGILQETFDRLGSVA